MARFQVVVLAFLFMNFNLTGAKRTVSGSGNSMDVVSSVPESDSLLDLDCDVDAEDQEIYGPKLQSRLCPRSLAAASGMLAVDLKTSHAPVTAGHGKRR